jgi:uncharacterized protein YifN (PemK superfamily)
MIKFHPEIGTILICDFDGFIEPEMVKRRPVIVISPRFKNRNGLCTIVPLSTTLPKPVMPYHYKLKLDEPLPAPFDSPFQWVKADMVATVCFTRLFFPKEKDAEGKRENLYRTIEAIDLRNIRACVLHAISLSHLTGHL